MRLTAASLFVLCLTVGCSSAPEGSPPSAGDNMADMKELLQDYQQQKKNPATKFADFKSFEPVHPLAIRQLQREGIVYVWGAAFGSGSGVIAYPKDAAEKGGTVLLQDGTLKPMTAAEFAAAPKAAGKK